MNQTALRRPAIAPPMAGQSKPLPGAVRLWRYVRRLCVVGLCGPLLVLPALAQTPATLPAPGQPSIHLIWMGGDDCPPCKAWRTTELPQLLAAPEFQGVRFSYVTKTIRSQVPPASALPPEVRPLKEALDRASGGRTGSPQAALVVDGRIYDYYVSARPAETVLEMIGAVRGEWRYPLPRCLQMAAKGRECVEPAP